MNRTERLAALLLLLQSRHERLTAAEIATHFGVSRRTALRDMAALSAMGVPVQSTDGAGGGYSLPLNYNPTPLPLNLREAMLLLLALSGIEKLAAAPYGDARETLAAKLRALLSPAQRDAAAALLSKVALDVPDRSSHPAPFLDALAGAAQTGHWVAARYRSESRGVTTDVPLLPVRPSAYGGFWYCEAHAHERGGERRTYRVDRFEAVESTGAPPGAQLAARTDYGDPSHPEVRVALSPRGVALAEREPHTGGAVSRHADGSGAMVFRCPPSELPWWAGYFFRLGVEAEVVAPPDLRARVYALACAMAERYSRPPANGDRLLSPFSG